MGFKKAFLIFTGFFFLSKTSYPHAFYVSVCNIYEKNDSTFFSIRVFKDDVFDVLNINKESKNATEKENKKIEDYVKKNLKISFEGNNKELLPSRFGYEGSDYTETVNIVYVVGEVFDSGLLEISNTVLFDYLDEQVNVVGLKLNNKRESVSFNQNKKTQWVEII